MNGEKKWIKEEKNFQALSSRTQKELVRELNSKEDELEWVAIRSEPFKGSEIAKAWTMSKGSKSKTKSVTE